MNNKDSIKIVVELLKAHNIRKIVISPGGTNIFFAKAVQNDPFFDCYSVVDERSAMYFAIGLYLQTGEPIATSCTSAQATRNYIPGLTEAYYKNVPILAITMSKHPRFIGQEYMQAPNQTSLPKDSVKKSYMLPYLSDDNDYLHCMRLVNEAILELTHDGPGPVQLCIPWVDFALGSVSKNIKNINRYSDTQNININDKKILIVIGEHRPFLSKEKNAIEKFCEEHNCAVYVNHLSNYHGEYVFNGNLALSVMSHDRFVSLYVPDILISIGGQTGDYPFYRMMSDVQNVNFEHWRVNENGDVVDTYDKLTKVFQMSIETFFSGFEKENSTHEYFEIWNQVVSKKQIEMSLPFSNAFIAQDLHNKIPNNSTIQFSILNSLRVWNLFDLDQSIQCYSNVGAFGIDGGLSTLIGQSVVTDQLCFMIIGDLAFYYDMNSIGIRHIKNNLRIILINNNGGVEFKLNKQNNEETDQYIAAANHFKNAEGWAKTCGFDYFSVRNKNEYIACRDQLLSISNKPILLEAFVSDVDDADAYSQILDQNREYDFKTYLKKSVKKFVGK